MSASTRPTHDHMPFRPEIEGLRALAVVPIMLNHARVPGFGGGFIGVDIFFVISGFLITLILIRDVGKGTYSIAEFYRRRILRIFPALFAMLVVVTAIAIVATTPNELVRYARSLAATVLFISNIQFYIDTGYFSDAASSRPLLHSWSLAVEEQFYIVWPLLVSFAAARGRRLTWIMLGCVVAISLAVACWALESYTNAVFYLIPFRAWELGVGGLLALLPVVRAPRLVLELLSAAGIAVILFCIRTYTHSMAFPGAAALLPCLGTAAIIFAGSNTLAGRFLALAPLRFFGRISYSLYLWHWPVITFAALWLFLRPTDPLVIAGEVMLAIMLGTASYYLVERAPRRRLARLSTPQVLALGAAAMLIGVGVAGGILYAQGFPNRYPSALLATAQIVDANEDESYRRGRCFLTKDTDHFDRAECMPAPAGSAPRVALVGDSAAAHLWPGLAALGPRYQSMQATMAGCPPQIGQQFDRLPCTRFFRQALQKLAREGRVDAVLLAANWQRKDVDRIGATLDRLKKMGLPVILIGPMPRYDAPLPRLMFFADARNDPGLVDRHFDDATWAIDRYMRHVAARHGIAYLSPLDTLCPHHRCQRTDDRGLPIQFDYLHLTRAGSEQLMAGLAMQIDKRLGLPE